MASKKGPAKSSPKSPRKSTKTEVADRRDQAALLVAEDRLTDEQIAASLGVTRWALVKWKRRPEFAAKVEAYRAEAWERIKSRGIARMENRVARLDRDWLKMQRVIEARAEDLAGEVAGGETGHLVRQVKVIGQGKAAQTITEYAVDAGLLKELRAHEQQAAKELGQWTDQVTVTQRADPDEIRDAIAKKLLALENAGRANPPPKPAQP